MDYISLFHQLSLKLSQIKNANNNIGSKKSPGVFKSLYLKYYLKAETYCILHGGAVARVPRVSSVFIFGQERGRNCKLSAIWFAC